VPHNRMIVRNQDPNRHSHFLSRNPERRGKSP
jgi:hypothetical protein